MLPDPDCERAGVADPQQVRPQQQHSQVANDTLELHNGGHNHAPHGCKKGGRVGGAEIGRKAEREGCGEEQSRGQATHTEQVSTPTPTCCAAAS